MTRVNKYMVYNPKKDKPVKYYDNIENAINNAIELNDKEHTDILVLQVVANIENEKIKIIKAKSFLHHRELEIVNSSTSQ